MLRETHFETEHGILAYWASKDWNPERPTMFFFHGVAGDHTMFEPQFAFFKDAFNIIAWDAPGHGHSRPYPEFTIDEAICLLYEIADEEDVDDFIAVGQSVGGYFIQALMAREPEIVSAFIGIGATPYGLQYYSNADYAMMRKTVGMCKFTPWSVLKVAYATSATHTDTGYKNAIDMVSIFDKKEYMALTKTYCELFIHDNQDLVITCPTLIMRGEHDTIGKVRELTDAWHQHTGFDLKVIPGAGHNANMDCPDTVNQLIYDFITHEGLI